MATALVSIGSNLGDTTETVRGAVESLGRMPGVEAVRGSRLYRSRAVGGPGGQRVFVNAAALLETSLSPAALLQVLHEVEGRFGRTRSTERWEARTLDLDLLLHDDAILAEADLTLPHPRMSFRRFVLEPAAEIAAEMRHPLLGCTLGELLGHLDTAPHYIAVGGSSRSTRAWLATAIGRALGAPVLTDGAQPRPAGESVTEHPPVPPLTEVLEFVKRASGLLHRGYWSAHPELRPLLDPSSGGSRCDAAAAPAVSDFWIEEWRLSACLYGLNERARPEARHDHQRLMRMFEEYTAEIVAPKLVIWADAGPALPSRMQERLPMCLDDLFRQPPCHALLRLDGNDPDWMLAESVAAIQAMQPLEGVVS